LKPKLCATWKLEMISRSFALLPLFGRSQTQPELLSSLIEVRDELIGFARL
jgi:hypothetical protein